MKKLFRLIIAILAILVIAFFAMQKKDISLETLKQKYCNADSKFIDLDGMHVHYRIEGEGKPIVLIHGTGACLQSWDGWIDSLRAHHFKIIRLDMPGFGITGPRPDADYSAKTYAKFLDEFLTKINIDTFDLAGNSLGGEIAWNYAAMFPDKVSHLILVDPAGFYLKQTNNPLSVFSLAKHKWLASLMGKMDTKILVKQTLKDVYYDESKIPPYEIEMYHDMSLREGNRKAFTDRVQQIGREAKPDLSPIKSKTLLMWGKYDKLLDVSLAKNFQSIPGMKYIEYDKCGHSPQEEIPQQSVTDAVNFIENN